MPTPAQDEPDDVADVDEALLTERAAVRRVPRYRAFVGVGALAGLVIAAVGLLAVNAGRGSTGSGPVLLLAAAVAVVAIGVSGLIAAVVAVLLDRPARH